MIEELEAALAQAGTVRVAVDAGAHFGTWTQRLLSIGAVVHAIEPCPFNRGKLLENLRARHGLMIYGCAISDTDGEADLYVGCPSTIPSIDPRWPEREFPQDYVDKSQKVRVETLRWSSFCEGAHVTAVDLLKLDCEGMDARILGDLAETGPFPRVIVAEVCSVGDLGEELASAERSLTLAGYAMRREFTLDGGKCRYNRIYVRDGA